MFGRRVLNCRFSTSSSYSSVSDTYYDIVIVGGGIVGNTMAAALNQINLSSSAAHTNIRPLSIALIDRMPGGSYVFNPSTFGNRVSSITPGSQRFLSRIGVWDRMDLSRVYPYTDIQVWDDKGGSIHFSPPNTPSPLSGCDDGGNSSIAYMVENQNLLSAAFNLSSASPSVDIYSATSVSDISLPSISYQSAERSSSEWNTGDGFAHLVLDAGQKLRARLVIGADGYGSQVRQAAGFDTVGWSYNQRGLVATLHHEARESPTAFQKFAGPLGIVAVLPLSDECRSSLVWSCPPTVSAKLSKMSASHFCTTLNSILRLPGVSETEYILSLVDEKDGRVSSVEDLEEEMEWRFRRNQDLEYRVPVIAGVEEGSRASFPLRFQKSSSVVDHRVAIIGDAAHTIHPMAGQGVNLGLSDAENLAHILEESYKLGQDIGSYISLKRYQRESELRTAPMMMGIEVLWNMFNTDSSVLGQARALGMSLLDKAPYMKQRITEMAMNMKEL